MNFNPENYDIDTAEVRDARKITRFYNGVIDYARSHPGRDIRWSRFTVEQVRKLASGESDIEGEELLVVKRREKLGRGAIAGAVIVNELDREAWQDDVGRVVLPEWSLHFAKFATDPELVGFGEQVLWPKLQEFARAVGYHALHFEAYDFSDSSIGRQDSLRQYYENTLGATYAGRAVYYSSYYKTNIGEDPPVNRFYFPLT